jgi:hypothetical protein
MSSVLKESLRGRLAGWGRVEVILTEKWCLWFGCWLLLSLEKRSLRVVVGSEIDSTGDYVGVAVE